MFVAERAREFGRQLVHHQCHTFALGAERIERAEELAVGEDAAAREVRKTAVSDASEDFARLHVVKDLPLDADRFFVLAHRERGSVVQRQRVIGVAFQSCQFKDTPKMIAARCFFGDNFISNGDDVRGKLAVFVHKCPPLFFDQRPGKSPNGLR